MNYHEFVKRISLSPANKPADPKDLKPNKLIPVYVFYGPESFFREKGLNLIKTLYGSDEIKKFLPDTFNTKDFFNELYSVPFFQKKKLIILDLGKINLLPHSTKVNQEIEQAVEEYLQAPSLFSSLVISSEKWLTSSRLSRLTEKNGGVLIECPTMSRYQLGQWIVNEALLNKKSIALPLAQLLIEDTGPNLRKIDEIIQQLFLLVHPRKEIGPGDLKKLVTKDKEYVIKELSRAVISKKTSLALRILTQLLLEGTDSNKIIGYLRATLKGKSSQPKELKLSFRQLLDTDLAIKTGLMPEDRALQLLVLNLTQ